VKKLLNFVGGLKKKMTTEAKGEVSSSAHQEHVDPGGRRIFSEEDLENPVENLWRNCCLSQ
jgi:hypothetical protein